VSLPTNLTTPIAKCTCARARTHTHTHTNVQIIGYGLMRTYHAKNEYGLLSDFEQGFQVIYACTCVC
jgi:hypothetical protein